MVVSVRCRFLFAIFLGLLSTYAYCQTAYIACKGRVVDSQTKEPLAFASVAVLNHPLGVITNSYGEFVFNIPVKYSLDSLSISFIGYQTIKVAIKNINSNSVNVFQLSSNSITLNEFIIRNKRKRPNVKGILRKAIDRIPENYPMESFCIEGYYRDYIKNGTNYNNLIEAALRVDDQGFAKCDYKTTRVKIEQIRVNSNYSFDTSQVVKYDNLGVKFIPYAHVSPSVGNEFSMLRMHDPVRNHAYPTCSFIDILDKDFVPNHRFTLESVTWQDSIPIFKIRIKATDYVSSSDMDYNISYLAEGYIYINTITFAIMKLEYSLTCSGRKNTYKIIDMQLEYHELRHKMYLSYFSFMNMYQTVRDGTLRSFNQYREFFVNRITPQPFVPLKDEELMLRDSSLLKNNVKPDPDFWERYNYVRTNSLLK
jgi:hypothetical protein